MNLQRRLKRVSDVLNIKKDTTYFIMRSQEQGGSIILYGEEGRKYTESTNTPDRVTVKYDWATILLPPRFLED
jgi:hypothetical protein